MNMIMTPKRGLSNGFTLVELIIVVLILGIIAMSALPSLKSGLEHSKLSGATSEITVALEYAQLAAMTTGETYRVTIDDAADSILVERFEINADIVGGGSELAEADMESGTFETMASATEPGEDYLIVFADEERFKGIDIASASFGGGNTVTFNAVGVPSNGGTVMLSYGSTQIPVTLDSLSGRVTSSY